MRKEKLYGIPTTYKGVRFRSRLEARWAKFFDAMKWPWAYEPVDCQGWIPDFILGSDLETGAYVEVKPYDWRKRRWELSSSVVFDEELNAAKECVPISSRGFLVCGLQPMEEDSEFSSGTRGGLGNLLGPVWEPLYRRIIWPCLTIHHDGPLDLCIGKSEYSIKGLVTGLRFENFDCSSPFFSKEEAQFVTNSWIEAGNKVQWRAA